MFFLLINQAQAQPVTVNRNFDKYKKSYDRRAENFLLLEIKHPGCMNTSKVKIRRQLDDHTVIAEITDTTALTEFSSCITKALPINHLWKLSPALERQQALLLQKGDQETLFTIIAQHLSSLLTSLNNQKIRYRLIHTFPDANAAVIQCRSDFFFNHLLNEPELLFADIYEAPQPDIMAIGYDRSISQLQAADHYFPNANGRQITVGIKEKAMDEKDIDLQQRIQASVLAATEKDNHATTIATLVGGAGNSYYTGKGMASRCSFFPSSFSNLFPDSTSLLVQKNISVQNHSYGTVVQSFYGAEALGYDVQTTQQRSLVHVFSSGNSGTSAGSTGAYANITGFANLTGNFKMAKNVLTVAAVDSGSRLTAFSSSGPLYDGRLAPQVTALGPNGTSEATAIVSGLVAVVQQVYKDSNVQVLPPASLVKALLYNACDDIGDKGIDYHSGFGLINAYKTIRNLQQKKYDGSQLTQSQVWTKNLAVPASAANLKITLSWTDTAALVNNYSALINDLDLEVTELSTGTIFRPWVLSSFAHADSLKKGALRRRDSLNTAEQVSIELPAAGNYQVRVTARKVITIQPQAFHIAYDWDTLNKIRFVNPVDATTIDRLENPVLRIKWSGVLADTNAIGNLSVSYNNGQSWQLMSSGIALKNQLFYWSIPDTTAIAQFRMDAAFGPFYSERFTLSPLCKLHVDYLCTDSLRLSWTKNNMVNQYQVLALRDDTAFLKTVLISTDTFTVLYRSQRPENVYAIQPVITNGPLVARSIALDVRNQGVNCFYNTLFAATVNDQIALTLNLSFIAGVDSVAFEKVTAGGMLKAMLQKRKVVTGMYNYTAIDPAPETGTNYYRAKIWTGSRFVYSEIVSILHHGPATIVLYPNLVSRGQNIYFRIREAAGDAQLQLIDMTGRLIRSQTVSSAGEIKTGNLYAGMYLYRLVKADGRVLATGKMVVQ